MKIGNIKISKIKSGQRKTGISQIKSKVIIVRETLKTELNHIGYTNGK